LLLTSIIITIIIIIIVVVVVVVVAVAHNHYYYPVARLVNHSLARTQPISLRIKYLSLTASQLLELCARRDLMAYLGYYCDFAWNT
jgi:uncharacterized membrane protein YbhN (UPF0104 family)